MTTATLAPAPRALTLPAPRGPLSAWVLARLTGHEPTRCPPVRQDGFGDDVQLALYLAYESHFSTLPGVVADVEWDPALIAFRRALEAAFEDALRQSMPSWADRTPVARAIPEILQLDDGPSLSAHMERDGTLDEMRELVVHRSAYQLKEGDGHTFAIPRLHGRAKQLLVEIQAGEYGADAPGRTMHSTLFAQTMRHLGLDDRLHAYLDVLPASALAVSNLISMFGLNRRWRGALVGHLAVFEMTSVTPMGRYTRGLERLGASAEARRFYDVHVLADAEHERMALEMAVETEAAEPQLRPDIIFGARCAGEVDRRFAATLFDGWRRTASATRLASA
ncbi:MAG: iron-containing redox enzyme family protein [Ilumatobacteraceae bacterium]